MGEREMNHTPRALVKVAKTSPAPAPAWFHALTTADHQQQDDVVQVKHASTTNQGTMMRRQTNLWCYVIILLKCGDATRSLFFLWGLLDRKEAKVICKTIGEILHRRRDFRSTMACWTVHNHRIVQRRSKRPTKFKSNYKCRIERFRPIGSYMWVLYSGHFVECDTSVYSTAVLNWVLCTQLSSLFIALSLDEFCLRDSLTTTIRFCVTCV